MAITPIALVACATRGYLAPGASLGPVGLAVTALTALVGILGTVAWWYGGDAGK